MLIKVKEQPKQITNSIIAADIFRDILLFENEVDQDKEHFWAIGLNAKRVISYVELVSLGTLTSSLVSPREVFRMAILKAAASIMVGHNHPSGCLEPSFDDISVTYQLKEAGRILGISLIDHVIICKDKYKFKSIINHELLSKTSKGSPNKESKERRRKAS